MVIAQTSQLRGNKGFFVEIEDSDKVEVTHNIVNDGQQLLRGRNITEFYVHFNEQRPPDAVDTFVSEASQYFNDLTPEQQQEFPNVINALKDRDENIVKGGLQWLYDLSVAIPGSGIAAVILKFLGY